MLRVIVYANRVCNGNVTLPQKNKILPGFWGVAFGSGPYPVDLIPKPLEYFEHICTAQVETEKVRLRQQSFETASGNKGAALTPKAVMQRDTTTPRPQTVENDSWIQRSFAGYMPSIV